MFFSIRMDSTTPLAAAVIKSHTEQLVMSVSLNLLRVSMVLLQDGLIPQQTYDITISSQSSLTTKEKSAQLVNAIFTKLCVNPSRLQDYLAVLQPIPIVGEVVERIQAKYGEKNKCLVASWVFISLTYFLKMQRAVNKRKEAQKLQPQKV